MRVNCGGGHYEYVDSPLEAMYWLRGLSKNPMMSLQKSRERCATLAENFSAVRVPTDGSDWEFMQELEKVGWLRIEFVRHK